MHDMKISGLRSQILSVKKSIGMVGLPEITKASSSNKMDTHTLVTPYSLPRIRGNNLWLQEGGV